MARCAVWAGAYAGFSAVISRTAGMIILRLKNTTPHREKHHEIRIQSRSVYREIEKRTLHVQDAGDVSKQLQAVINEHAGQGWEYVNLNDVNIEVKPGCLAGMFGSKTAYFPLDQVIFRRPAGQLPPPLPTA